MRPTRFPAARACSCLRLALVLIAALGSQGCLVLSRTPEYAFVEPAMVAQPIDAPLRAHLADGSIVVFPDGARVEHDSLIAVVGDVRRYSLGLGDTLAVRGVPLAAVAGAERYDSRFDTGRTLLHTLVANGFLALLVAITIALDAISG